MARTKGPAERVHRKKEANKVLLTLSGCQDRESTNFGAIELDVYAVNEGILRYARSIQLYEDYLSGLGRNLHGPIV